MSSTLPVPALDPRFDAARKHADTLRSGVRITVAASVALGLELLRLKEEIGAAPGRKPGNQCNNSTNSWKESVARETGFSYERCADFMKAARAVRERFIASRKKGDAEVKLIVQSPPSSWTTDDYDQFATHVAEQFHADTFKALMEDLFPAPEKTPGPGNNTPPSEIQADFYKEMMAAHACIAVPVIDLNRRVANPIEFARDLYHLPLEDMPADPDTGRPAITGLLTLRHILTLAGDAIDQALEGKRKERRRG